ncbi:MAG: NapC/NirT family cytochrome c [Anaerolinea sp.]|nr:NapC/NirT family cytochrome c [Anaerolinea sp.]
MRKLFSAIKRFFFPPAGSALWLRALPFVIMGILTISVISGSVYGWTYTNSSEFCGTTCHTMPPEYSAYQRSPHARVQCVECHIGRDVVTTQFSRKAGDLRHVYLTITQDYEFPIFSRAMRPARESCETCHFPEKFSDDSLREVKTFHNDAMNTPESVFLIMKTGGGSKREGLGQGIHWHVENEVWYLATDVLEQDIPYVRTVDEEGHVTEYYDIASDMTPEDVAGTFLTRMDCITCHNRITHNIPTPEKAVDLALSKGLISPNLLYVRNEAVTLLSEKYESLDEANETIATLADFYAQNYPDLYAAQQDAIEEAVIALQDIYMQMVFPEQELDWETHPDNLGHKNAPGCFRCHDGKHLTGTEEAIRLECNLCHSVPVMADNSLVTNIEIAHGPEPRSHTHSSWITLHGRSIDRSCATCHAPADPAVNYVNIEGKPPADGSFCGNVPCHANEWDYTGFNDPALEPVLARQLYILLNTSPYLLEGVPRTYVGTFKAMLDGRCAFCHSGPQAEAGLDLSSYEAMMRGGSEPIIIAGDPEASLLVQRQSGPMEHFGQILAEELNAVKEWIAIGAPEK